MILHRVNSTRDCTTEHNVFFVFLGYLSIGVVIVLIASEGSRRLGAVGETFTEELRREHVLQMLLRCAIAERRRQLLDLRYMYIQDYSNH